MVWAFCSPDNPLPLDIPFTGNLDILWIEIHAQHDRENESNYTN